MAHFTTSDLLLVQRLQSNHYGTTCFAILFLDLSVEVLCGLTIISYLQGGGQVANFRSQYVSVCFASQVRLPKTQPKGI